MYSKKLPSGKKSHLFYTLRKICGIFILIEHVFLRKLIQKQDIRDETVGNLK